jgi:hypothetical protein
MERSSSALRLGGLGSSEHRSGPISQIVAPGSVRSPKPDVHDRQLVADMRPRTLRGQLDRSSLGPERADKHFDSTALSAPRRACSVVEARDLHSHACPA